ncbi:unnamed protein product [Musa acuminata subsp. burmannicoides]
MGGGVFSETGETPSRPRQSLENISEPILDYYNARTRGEKRRAPTLIQDSSVAGAPIHPPPIPPGVPLLSSLRVTAAAAAAAVMS